MSAYQDTDKELKRMEKFLSKQFRDAEKEIKRKAAEYLKKFDKADKEKQQQVLEGKLTREEYARWREGKIMHGAHWENLLGKIQKELLNVNQTALDYMNGKVPEIFAVHYNDVAMQVRNSPVAGVSFEMIDSNTVKNLVNQKGLMLPPPKVLDKVKQITWNKKKINAAVLQGILQGDAINKIADRISSVASMNRKAAIRNARTMVTAAENSGRQSGLNRAEKDGIIFEKLWISAVDSRTRETHLALNGERVKNGEKFVTVNGELEFPGDWSAPACEVYNCRCSLGSVIIGFKKVSKLPEKANRILEENFKNELSPDQYNRLVKIFENNPTQAELLSENGTNIKYIREEGKGGWIASENKLFWHINQERDKTEFTTLFHELGHAYDQRVDRSNVKYSELEKLGNANLIVKPLFDMYFKQSLSNSDEFLAAMRKDMEGIRSIIESGDRSKIDPMVTGYTNGIQDFISGAFGYDPKFRVEVKWQHSEKYYNRAYDIIKNFNSVASSKEKLKNAGMDFNSEKEIKQYIRQYEAASELWAHLNSADACGKAQLTLIKQYCPNSYNAYKKILEGRK